MKELIEDANFRREQIVSHCLAELVPQSVLRHCIFPYLSENFEDYERLRTSHYQMIPGCYGNSLGLFVRFLGR
jgi:hypothetical protein